MTPPLTVLVFAKSKADFDKGCASPPDRLTNFKFVEDGDSIMGFIPGFSLWGMLFEEGWQEHPNIESIIGGLKRITNWK